MGKIWEGGQCVLPHPDCTGCFLELPTCQALWGSCVCEQTETGAHISLLPQ